MSVAVVAVVLAAAVYSDGGENQLHLVQRQVQKEELEDEPQEWKCSSMSSLPIL